MKFICILLLTGMLLIHAKSTFYTTGELQKEASYENGVLSGPTNVYYKSGKLRYTIHYKNGKEIDRTDYYSSGKIVRATNITSTNVNTDLLFYGYQQEQNNHFHQASVSYGKVCDSGNLNGCFYLGLLRMRLLDDVLKSKINGYPERAIEMWTQACDDSEINACFDLARLYAAKGDFKLSTTLYKKACDGGNMKGCSGLASHYEDGLGVEKNFIKLTEYYQKACDGNDMDGCWRLAHIYDGRQEFQKAYKLFEIACSGGDMKGCTSLGLAHEQSRGISEDYNKAKEYYTKACDNDYMFACLNLIRLDMHYGPHKIDDKKRNILEQKACDGGIGTSCTGLGFKYQQGHGVSINKVKAKEYYDKACFLGEESGCQFSETLVDR